MGWHFVDLRVAARGLVRRRAFSGVSIVTLALSIGAVTVAFSVMDGVLLRPLPYEEPDELVSFYLTSDEWRESENDLLRASWDVRTMSLAHIRAWRAGAGPLAAVAGYATRFAPIDVGDGTAESAEAVMIDEGLFDVLGVQPALGRAPTDEEIARSAPVAVLGHDLWVARFRGDPNVLGRSFVFDQLTYTVIGVMRPGFFFPIEDSELWIPVMEKARDWPSYYGVARLAPGATPDDATRFVETTTRRMGEDDAEQAGLGARALPHIENVTGGVRAGIRLLFWAALLVVVVACVNLGNLFLARASDRRDELAVRASLGASRRSLVGMMLTELLLIGAVGGGLGVVLAGATIEPFVDMLGRSVNGLPREGGVGLNTRVVAFALVATMITPLLAGLGPTLASARRAPTLRSVRGGTARRGTRLAQRVLLAAQGGLTVVLICGTTLLGRSLHAALTTDLGMDIEDLAVMEVRASRQTDSDERIANRRALRRRAAAIPGVTSATVAGSLPGAGGMLGYPVRVDGEDASSPVVFAVSAGEDYFGTTGIELLLGRGLVDEDDTRVGVVSESLATQLLGRTDVVGRTLLVGEDEVPMEIVGVAADARQVTLFQPPAPTLYEPVRAEHPWRFFVVMRIGGGVSEVLAAARREVERFGTSLELVRAVPMRALVADSAKLLRVRTILMGALTTLAAALAMIGIAGVVAQVLGEQTREVGIRMALGANAGRESRRVVRHALLPTAAGLTMGLVAAVSASRVMETFLYGIEPNDPPTYALAAGILLLAAGLAAWIPARRAAGIDPARVLSVGEA